MSSKDTPRWGWLPRLDDEDFERRFAKVDPVQIGAHLGLRRDDVDERFVDALAEPLKSLHFNYDYDPPSRASMKNSFRAIQKSADKLRQQLSELDTYSRLAVEISLDLVAVHESRQPGSEERSDNDRIAYPIEKLEEQLETLSALMGVHAENLVPKLRKGKRSTSALREFVRRMAELYRTITRHDAYAGFAWDADGNRYSGPFMIVLEDTLSQFCPDWQYTNHAIGEAVRRGLGRR